MTWTRTIWGAVADLRYGKALRGYSADGGTVEVFGTNGPIGWTGESLANGPRPVVGRKGAYRGVHLARGSFWVIDTAYWLEPSGELDPVWAYYKLLTVDINGMDSGSAIPSLTKSHFVSMPLFLPPLDEQRRIAEILGALDDLIDTNESSRDSLVALVNAEFDRRFALRPLGPTVGELAKVVDCLHSKKPEQSSEGGRILLQLNNIRDDGLMDLQSRYVISEKDYALWSKNLETEAHDLVVTNVGRVGAVARVPVGLTAALGRNMTAVRANDPAGDAAFITAALHSTAVRREIENKTDSGTILNALNVRSIPKLRLQDSTPEERKRFSEWALPLLEMCDSLIAHDAQLGRTRDELLPLLMSGAVRVRPEGVAA